MTDLEVEHRTVRAKGVELHLAEAGGGPPLVLLHGWPHTWQVWELVLGALAAQHRVIAMDLRGLGASTRAVDTFDARAVAADVLAVLDDHRIESASVMAIDASVPAAFLLAMDHPDRVSRLVLMESLLLPLPGAEAFLAAGPPWWFGFHAVPGLAETVIEGHEDDYVDWFLRTGTHDGRGVDAGIRDAFVAAYRGRDSLRCGFGYYRAMPANTAVIADAVTRGRLTVPTMAIGGDSVGDALQHQLSGVADDLVGHLIPDSGHIVPLDQPQALLDLVSPFLSGTE